MTLEELIIRLDLLNTKNITIQFFNWNEFNSKHIEILKRYIKFNGDKLSSNMFIGNIAEYDRSVVVPFTELTNICDAISKLHNCKICDLNFIDKGIQCYYYSPDNISLKRSREAFFTAENKRFEFYYEIFHIRTGEYINQLNPYYSYPSTPTFDSKNVIRNRRK